MHPRQIAKLAGEKRYFGKPCPHGHSGERLTVSGWCVECHRANVKKYAPKGTSKWAKANPEYMANARRKSHMKHKDAAYARVYAWRRANPWFARSVSAARRKRTPLWVDLKELQKFYAACPAGHEVDHIIPMKGKLVSGLHVAGNLQYLSRAENRQKSNRYAS